jgi:acetyl-CoA C-acetyltransferase
MDKRVAICAVAQTPYRRNNWAQRFQGMAWAVVKSLLDRTGLDFAEDTGIEHILTVSDDIFDARTISDNAMTDTVGAHYRSEEKVAQDGAQAVYYGLANILSGHAEVVLVVGHCKESQGASRNAVTHLAFDPFFTREVGMDYLVYNALQARAYMAASGVTEQQLGELVVRARRNALGNPATPEVKETTLEQVLASPYLAEPLREDFVYPCSDGAVGLVLASAERARELTDRPVWVTGVGNCYDHFFPGDRALASSFALRKAAERALGMAGMKVTGPTFDVVEVSDQCAHHLPFVCEGLGLCAEGQGRAWLEANGPEECGVNLSGGMLAGNPLILGGLVRVVEAALQLRDEAGKHQRPGAQRALAHGMTGPGGQLQTVVVLER